MKNYKILKLKSGEDLIGTVRVGKDGIVKIHRPMIMKTVVSGDAFGNVREYFVLKNWLSLSDDKVAVLSKDSINTIVGAAADVSELYDMEKLKQDATPKKRGKVTLNPLTPNMGDDYAFEDIAQTIQDMIKQMEKEPEHDSNTKDLAKPKFNDKMVFMNMVFSPNVIIEMLKNGMLNRKEFGEMINEITNENGEGMNPQKYTGNKKDKKNLGNDWTDWPANPDSSDYQ